MSDDSGRRRCLQEPIPAIFAAAERLSAAVDAHLFGDTRQATELIRLADCDEVRAWIEPLMGSVAQFPILEHLRSFRQVADAPPTLPRLARGSPRMPNREGERRIIARDGFNCVFCGVPVIRSIVRKRLTTLYPEEAYWGARCHAALWCMWLQFDHVIPHGRGGTSDDWNMVITCSGCNYGRMSSTLDEVGLIDPRLPGREKGQFDGLERLIAR